MCKADNNDPSGEEDNKSSADESKQAQNESVLLDDKQRKQSGSSDFGLIPKPK